MLVPRKAVDKGRPCLRPLAAALLALTPVACRRPEGPARTVVLLTIDTLRADHLGLYGDPRAQTPVIDALGREALVFDAAWTTAPLTLPAHASMLTGLLPPRHGVRANGVHRLDPGRPVVAEAFARAGYRTAAFIGAYPLIRRFGLARGFGLYDDEMPARADGAHYPERCGDVVTARAVQWLEAQPRDARIFLWVHLFDPHADYRPPAPFAERFADRPYDGEIAFTDELVGRLRGALERQRRWAQAALVLVADHGEGLGEHGEDTHGLLLHEATVRVPLLVKGPALAPGRAREPVSVVDVGPTLLALAGLPPLAAVDGVELSGRRDPGRDLYAETLAPYLDHGWSGLRALRRGRLKLVEGPTARLFDLAVDPAESRDLGPRPEAEALTAAVEAISARDAVSPAAAPLDATSRQALASLGYTAGGGAVPDDFGRGRPDPRTRMEEARALDAASALPAADAVRRLADLARTDPADNLVHRRLAAARMSVGDYMGAIRSYAEAGRRGYQGADLADAKAEAYRRAAETRMESGDLGASERLLAEGRRLAPGRADLVHAAGVVRARGGRLDEAIAAFREALAMDPGLASAWFSMGLALERRGRTAEAGEAYARYLARAGAAGPERAHAAAFLKNLRRLPNVKEVKAGERRGGWR